MLNEKFNHLNKRTWQKDSKGYLTTKLRQHQLIWLLEHGSLPEPPLTIDHVNGDKTDNRLENLRVADPYQQNINKPSWAKTGFIGVYYDPNRGKYRTKIMLRGKKTVYLGSYQTPQQAAIGRDLGGLFHLAEEDVPFLRLNFPERDDQYQTYLTNLSAFDTTRTAQEFLERFPSWL